MDNVREDWPTSLNIFGSVWMDALGLSRAVDSWSACLHLVEHLCLDLLSQMDFLLEHQAVCFNLLGPAYADDPYVWMFLHTWEWPKKFCFLFAFSPFFFSQTSFYFTDWKKIQTLHHHNSFLENTLSSFIHPFHFGSTLTPNGHLRVTRKVTALASASFWSVLGKMPKQPQLILTMTCDSISVQFLLLLFWKT